MKAWQRTETGREQPWHKTTKRGFKKAYSRTKQKQDNSRNVMLWSVLTKDWNRTESNIPKRGSGFIQGKSLRSWGSLFSQQRSKITCRGFSPASCYVIFLGGELTGSYLTQINQSAAPITLKFFQKRQKRELNHENLSMCKQTEGDKMHETAYQKAYNDGAEFSWKGKTLTQDVI